MEVHLENKLLPEELKEIRADLEQLKENDPKNQNKVRSVIKFRLV